MKDQPGNYENREPTEQWTDDGTRHEELVLTRRSIYEAYRQSGVYWIHKTLRLGHINFLF
jgi:hypothetical protein